MPTDPRWLEHTEKAAWDTVQSLRKELERERQRLERLTRTQPQMTKLVTALEEARREHSIEGTDDDQVLQRLGSLVRELTRERDALKLELEQRPRTSAVELTSSSPFDRHEENAPRLSANVRWFGRLLERRRRATGDSGLAHKQRDPARIVQALELKVEELAQARSHELLELAVDVGNLALLLARRARANTKR